MKNFILSVLSIVLSLGTAYFAVLGAGIVIDGTRLVELGDSLLAGLAIVYFLCVTFSVALGFNKMVDSWSKKK